MSAAFSARHLLNYLRPLDPYRVPIHRLDSAETPWRRVARCDVQGFWFPYACLWL